MCNKKHACRRLATLVPDFGLNFKSIYVNHDVGIDLRVPSMYGQAQSRKCCEKNPSQA